MASNEGSAPVNPLLSNQASELQAVLHPLVLLSISDYITRHTLREQPGPLVGGLMGQHNGREVTVEFAFDCHVAHAPDTPYQYRLDMAKVLARIEQMRTVHKDRNLDFVGWYTLLPKSGPSSELVHLHNDVLSHINESAVLLGFHPEEMLNHAVGGKLPLTVYESNYEVDDAAKADTEGDKKMTDSGDADQSPLKLRFREIGYAVETSDAEMISVDFVARGSGLATAVEPPKAQQKQQQKQQAQQQDEDKKGKGKEKAKDKADQENSKNPMDNAHVTLSPEEEETIAALTARANATKMLHARIQVLKAYLDRLPPAYVSGDDPTAKPETPGGADDDGQSQTTPSNTILRQIQALVGRLDLIEPSDIEAFRKETLRERNDVHLVSLLNDVMQSVKGVRGVGRKFEVLDGHKARELQQNRSKNWDLSAMMTVAAVGGGEGKGSAYGLHGPGDIILEGTSWGRQ